MKNVKHCVANKYFLDKFIGNYEDPVLQLIWSSLSKMTLKQEYPGDRQNIRNSKSHGVLSGNTAIEMQFTEAKYRKFIPLIISNVSFLFSLHA